MLLDTMPGKRLDLTKPRLPRTNACGQRLRFAAEALDVDTRSINKHRLGVKNKNKKKGKRAMQHAGENTRPDWKKVCGFWLAG